MFEDILHSYQELGHMLSDVQENYGEMHPEDVIEILRIQLLKGRSILSCTEGS